MPRRPQPELDPARFMQRVEDRIDQSFKVMLDELEKVKIEVRKGNLETTALKSYVADVERQVTETRAFIQTNEQNKAHIVVEVAETLASKADVAPKRVWQTRLGKTVVISTGFVAVIAAFNSLPKFVRGVDEVARSVWVWFLHHG